MRFQTEKVTLTQLPLDIFIVVRIGCTWNERSIVYQIGELQKTKIGELILLNIVENHK